MVLRRWWTEKYRLPSNHSLFLDSTPFDLLVEYYEDWFEDDPAAVLDTMRGEDGEVVFEDLEDTLLAKWEHEVSQGAIPDLEEGLSNEAKEKLAAERTKYAKASGKAVAVADINEDFSKAAERLNVTPTKKIDKRMDAKFVQPGSLEDAALTAAAQNRRRGGADMPSILGQEMTRGRRR